MWHALEKQEKVCWGSWNLRATSIRQFQLLGAWSAIFLLCIMVIADLVGSLPLCVCVTACLVRYLLACHLRRH